MDTTDREIVWGLDLNERISLTELAEKIGISKQALNGRLQKLTERGILTGHYAIIDTHRLGLLTYRAYLRLSSISPKASTRLIQLLAKHKNTLFVGTLSGMWDLEVVFVARNFIHFNELLRDLYEPFSTLVYRSNISMTPVVYSFKRDYLVTDKRKPSLPLSYGFEPGPDSWDELDYGILASLSKDARASFDSIARELKVTSNTVKSRVAKLEEKGIIRAYRPLVSIEHLGRIYAKALICCAPMSRKELETLYRRFSQNVSVVYLTEVLGSWQLEVEAEVTDVSELEELVRTVRSEFPQKVLEYDTVVVRQVHKLNYLPGGTATKDLVVVR